MWRQNLDFFSLTVNEEDISMNKRFKEAAAMISPPLYYIC